jgi:hypothetical protein
MILEGYSKGESRPQPLRLIPLPSFLEDMILTKDLRSDSLSVIDRPLIILFSSSTVIPFDILIVYIIISLN